MHHIIDNKSIISPKLLCISAFYCFLLLAPWTGFNRLLGKEYEERGFE